MSTMTLDRRRGSAPDRSLTQRMEALQRANGVRSRRAALKRDLKAGRRSAVDVLRDPPEFVGSMKAFDLLLACPKVGRVKASKLVTQARIAPSKTIGGMTDRQRGELVGLLARRFPAELGERAR